MKHISVLWILGCLLFSQLLFAEDDSVESKISNEYGIKAGYIYNFTKFVTWNVDNAEAFNICILGVDPFGELIDPIQKRLVMGRPIILFRLNNLSSKEQHCHILYVSSSIKDKLSVQDVDNTLVVGENGEFLEQGGMIGFVNKQGKIKLKINLKTIKQSGLKVSAKLLEVADVVKGDGND